jgi:RNA polymerase sigma-70 factor (ECF subfamily)
MKRRALSFPRRADAGAKETDAPGSKLTNVAGDDDVSRSLDAVVSRFGNLMHRIGLNLRLPEAEIDEAIQDVRIRLWRTLASEPGAARRLPATYIYRTTMSAMLDLIRRRRSRREAAIESLDDRVVPLPAVGLAPDAGLHVDDLARQVEASIDEIAESRRPVVRMYLAGYAREEIGQLLGWSEPKTRNLLYRGMDDLRARLAVRGIGKEIDR